MTTVAPPVTVTADNWRIHAACAMDGINPDLWFRAPEERSPHSACRQRNQALAICRHCPARRHCIEDELRTGSRDGRRAMTRGGWWWTAAGLPRPHPDDRDLMARHYPKETR